jgi:hypothetical protein
VIAFFLALLVVPALAQDLIGLAGDSPFSSALDAELVAAGAVRARTFGGALQFPRADVGRVGVSGRYLRLENDGAGVPDFTSLNGGLTFQRPLGGERSLSALASYGSASDRPFRDGRDATMQLNVLYRSSPNLIWLGNYSNNRAFLNNVPLPGVLYVGEQSRERAVLVGFPFVNLLLPIARGALSFRYLAVLPFNHRLKLSYTGVGPVRPFAAVEQLTQVFFDSARRTDGLRIFWFERRASLGLETSFGPALRIEAQAGAAFDREFFVARTFRGSVRARNPVADAGFAGITLRSLF